MASWTGNPEIWNLVDLQRRTWPRIFPFSLVKWSTDAVLGKAPSGPIVLPLLDLCPGREVGRYLPISRPFLAPSPARASSDGKRVALSPFHMCREQKKPGNPEGDPRGAQEGTEGQKWDLLRGKREWPAMHLSASKSSLRLNASEPDNIKDNSGCGAVLWVYDTCYHYLSLSSNMVLSPRVYLIIIKLKTCYIPKIFWKQ